MGKVSFPLVNSRKDVTGEWHSENYHTTETAEEITVSAPSELTGYCTAFLKEIPESSTDVLRKVSITDSSGVTLTSTTSSSEVIAVTGTNKYYVNYSTGEVLFNAAQTGKTLIVYYYGRGSLVEAEDINYVYDNVVRLDNIITGLEIEPELTNMTITIASDPVDTEGESTKTFKLSNEEFIRECNDEVTKTYTTTSSTSAVDNTITFKWNIKMQTLFDENSLKLTYKKASASAETDPTTIVQGLQKSTTSYEWNLNGSPDESFNEETTFTLSASLEEESKTFTFSFKLKFVSGIFYGNNADAKINSIDNLNIYLSNSSKFSRTYDFELTDKTSEVHRIPGNTSSSVVGYKFVVFPDEILDDEKHPIPRFYDNNTGFSIAMDTPITVYISRSLNDSGVMTYTASSTSTITNANKKYYLYPFAYKVNSAINVREEF